MRLVVGGEVDDAPEVAIDRVFGFRHPDPAEVQRGPIGRKGYRRGRFAGDVEVRALDLDGEVAGPLPGRRPPLGSAHRYEEWRGISPFATPSALYAIFAYLRAPTAPEEVLRVAVGAGGDVDTVAAMAGAMVGAAVGLDGLTPRLTRWAAHLNAQGTFGFDELVAIARAVQ